MQGLSTYSWQQFWPEYWPRGLIVFLSVVQSFLTFAIFSLQLPIVIIMTLALPGYYLGTYTLGFVSWAFFLASAIANCCVSCCNNLNFGCATYGAIQNLCTFIFSAILIDSSRKTYLLTSDYLSGIFDCSNNPFLSVTTFCSIAIPMGKALLASSVLMLVSALAYIGAYIYTLVRVLQKNRTAKSSLNAGHYPRSDFSGELPAHMKPMDAGGYGVSDQNKLYPMQNAGYGQAQPPYPMQQEHQRAPKVRYNPGGVSIEDGTSF